MPVYRMDGSSVIRWNEAYVSSPSMISGVQLVHRMQSEMPSRGEPGESNVSSQPPCLACMQQG